MTTDAESLPAAAEPTAAGSRFWIVASDDAPRRHDPADSFANLDEALAALGRRPAAETVGDDPRIVRQAAGAPPRIAGKPRHRFFVIVQSADGGGDGTESSPWWGLGAATAALIARSRDESLLPKDGDHMQISCRHVYAPSPLESRKRRSEQFAAGLFGVMAAALVLPLIAILLWLVVKAWPALSPAFIWENPRDSMTAGGIWAPLVGTFFLVFMSLLIAAPVGILAGVYLHEYARDNWFTRLINLAVVNLAGVPSIVHGLFGVGAFVLFANFGRSVLAAACTLAVMTLPVIITSTREALAAVPVAFREACWNMGATRWQTIRTIVLPNAISGILTGVILQVARAAGETAPILFTGAVYYVPVPNEGLASFFPYSLTDRCMALSMHLFTLLTQVLGVPEATEYGTAVVLIGLVLAVNSVSIAIRSYLRSRKKW